MACAVPADGLDAAGLTRHSEEAPALGAGALSCLATRAKVSMTRPREAMIQGDDRVPGDG